MITVAARSTPTAFRGQPALGISRLSAGGKDQAAADLAWGLRQLDADKDGKVLEADLDMLLELIYGVRPDALPASWRQLKGACEDADGTLKAGLLASYVTRGSLTADLREAAASASCSSAEGQNNPKGGPRSNPRLGPFSSVREYLTCFRSYDKDGNGVVCASDLRQACLGKLGLDWPLQRCRDLVHRVDSDGDCVVGINDFGALVEQLALEQEQEEGEGQEQQ